MNTKKQSNFGWHRSKLYKLASLLVCTYTPRLLKGASPNHRLVLIDQGRQYKVDTLRLTQLCSKAPSSGPLNQGTDCHLAFHDSPLEFLEL